MISLSLEIIDGAIIGRKDTIASIIKTGKAGFFYSLFHIDLPKFYI